MKDSEIIARLIYDTVTPYPSEEDLRKFIAALGCYSRQLQREEADAPGSDRCAERCGKDQNGI